MMRSTDLSKLFLASNFLFSFFFGLLLSTPAFAFQILSPTTIGCHERMTLGVLGYETGGYRGDGLPSTASLMNRLIAKANAIGVPTNSGTKGIMREMSNRYHWEGLSEVEKFVLASFVAGVRSPDTNGSSIIDFNKLRSTHLRDTEQSAHTLRRRGDDDPNGDTAGIAAARDRVSRILERVDTEWVNNPYRKERWTFSFRGEHEVTFFATAFDLGAAMHTLQDSYAHALRDSNLKILALENYLEVLIDDFHEDRDGVKHSDRLDQCNPDESFDLMRITEARKQVSAFLVQVDGALASSSSSLAAVQPTLNTVFAYQAGCDRANEYCGSVWWLKAKEDFSSPYSVGCGLLSTKGGGPLGPISGSPIAALFLLMPLAVWFLLRKGFRRPRIAHAAFLFAAVLGTSLFIFIPAAHAKTSHVILISVDGLGRELLNEARMPNLKRIAREGSSAENVSTTHPVATVPAHVTMATGVPPTQHKITWNKNDDKLEPVESPTIFQLLQMNKMTSIFITGKEKLARVFAHHPATETVLPQSLFFGKSHGRLPRVVTREAETALKKKPELLFIHYAIGDTVGHVFGWNSLAQHSVLRDIDASIGAVEAEAKKVYGQNGYVMIVTADHGGHEASHGRTKPDGSLEDEKHDLFIPWIISGARLKPKLKSMNVQDTSPSIASLLGLTVPSAWKWQGESVVVSP